MPPILPAEFTSRRSLHHSTLSSSYPACTHSCIQVISSQDGLSTLELGWITSLSSPGLADSQDAVFSFCQTSLLQRGLPVADRHLLLEQGLHGSPAVPVTTATCFWSPHSAHGRYHKRNAHRLDGADTYIFSKCWHPNPHRHLPGFSKCLNVVTVKFGWTLQGQPAF